MGRGGDGEIFTVSPHLPVTPSPLHRLAQGGYNLRA